MSTSTQPRRPAGTPAGGQWAPAYHSEPDIDLANNSQDKDEEGTCPSCKGAGLVNFQRCSTCRGHGSLPTAKDWASVGVTDLEALVRLDEGRYRPEDLSARDPNLRLGAHSAAGTLVLDGELLSTALQLHNHEKSLDPTRCYQQRNQIVVDGKPVRWLSLSGEEQRDHIAGYAAGAAGKPVPDGSSELFEAGWRQGQLTEETARRVDAGELDEVEVVDVSGRVTTASDFKLLGHGLYTGFLAPAPLRPYQQKAMFSRDNIVGPAKS